MFIIFYNDQNNCTGDLMAFLKS